MDFIKDLNNSYIEDALGYVYRVCYEDDFLKIYSCRPAVSRENPKLSLCDNLDYKNDVKSLLIKVGGSLYKLTGEHLDQIRGKLIQIPEMFKLDFNRDILLAPSCILDRDNLLGLWTCSPLIILFKHCKFTKIEDTKR